MDFDPAAAANRMADRFFAASDAVDRFRLGVRPPLPRELMNNLRDISHALESRAQLYTAQAIGATLASIEDDLASIEKTTTDATTQLEHLQNVEKGISIATSLLSLCTAIAAGDASTILAASSSLAGLLT
jgi:hypothetical protein